MPTLSAAIERLYGVFARHPRPDHIPCCSHCIDRQKKIDVLLTKNLRDITTEELGSYTFSAFFTVGDVPDYLYLLPRILELSATDPAWWLDPEIICRGIFAAGLPTWPQDQRDTLTDYLDAVIANAIANERLQLDQWICAIARLSFDVTPYLQQIAESPEAVLAYFELNAEELPRGKLRNAFWEDSPIMHDVVVNWFFSEPIARIPFEAYGYVLTRDE